MYFYIFTNIYKHKLLFASGISMIASLISLYWKTNNDPSAHFFTMIPETWIKGCDVDIPFMAKLSSILFSVW